MLKITLTLLGFMGLVALVASHGMLLNPPNRSSLWRFDSTALRNYQDSQNFCGGNWNQHGVHKGKCGVCGDDYGDARPRANENTGYYGTGRIVATYNSSTVIEVDSAITANHLGDIQFHLCKLTDSNAPESGEECFEPLPFEDGTAKYPVLSTYKNVKNHIRLPKGFTCRHCTLRWTYTAGNNWGVCEDGTGKMGCGPQETFRSCSDISIV